jgi:hypothetical protein
VTAAVSQRLAPYIPPMVTYLGSVAGTTVSIPAELLNVDRSIVARESQATCVALVEMINTACGLVPNIAC